MPVFREALQGTGDDPEYVGDELLAVVDGLTEPRGYPPEQRELQLRRA